MNAFFGVSLSALVTLIVACQSASAQSSQARQGSSQSMRANGTLPLSPEAGQNEEEKMIKANLAKLGPDDAQLAGAQGFCPIMAKNRLGVLGSPIKVMLKNQVVFVCCESCAKKAVANPDATLASLVTIKAKMAEAEISASLAKLTPEDRRLAEAQGFCPVMTGNRLGVMGAPVKIMVNGQPVFLCCAGCRMRALANPDRTLALVAQFKAKVADAAARKAKSEAVGSQR